MSSAYVPPVIARRRRDALKACEDLLSSLGDRESIEELPLWVETWEWNEALGREEWVESNPHAEIVKDLWRYTTPQDRMEMWHKFGGFPNLKVFRLGGCGEDPRKGPQYTEIPCNLSDEELALLVPDEGCMRGVETLHLIHTTCISDVAIQHMATVGGCGPALKHLMFWDCHCSDATFQLLSPGPMLETLYLWRLKTHITDRAFEFFRNSECGCSMTTLRLIGLSHVTDEAFRCLRDAGCGPCLRVVQLQDIPGLTDRGILLLAESGCGNVDEVSVKIQHTNVSNDQFSSALGLPKEFSDHAAYREWSRRLEED